jgi:hypothetical protein
MPDDLDVTHHFANFLYSFGAVRKLLERAHGPGFLIEAIVLYVSLIDGLLRIALVLDKRRQRTPATLHGRGQAIP